MKSISILWACILVSATLHGQPKFEYSDIAAGKFAQKTVSGLRSMADGEHYTVVRDNVILKYSYATGQLTDTLCDVYKYVDNAVSFDGYEFSRDERKILITLDSNPVYRRSALSMYAVFDINARQMILLGMEGMENIIRYAALSPDGNKVALVVSNNIYIEDLEHGTIRQVTSDGVPNSIINGIPDWVYEEEFHLYHALRWSPEGDRIAFLKFDETEVADYAINYFIRAGQEAMTAYAEGNLASPLYPLTYYYKYPKAGEKNSVVTLHVYDLGSAETVQADTGAQKDQYVPYFDWTPDGQLYFFRINRLQNHLCIYLADKQGAAKSIYEETSPKYIDNVDLGTITFLPDSKRFVIRNETATGFSHLYMYHVDKGFQYPITKGPWEVKDVVSITERRVWFTSNETSSLRTNLYSCDLKGKGKKRLTPLDGTYRISPSEGCKYYISYFSNSNTPNTVILYSGDGKYIRTLEDNAALKSYISGLGMPQKEYFTFTVHDAQGNPYELNAYIVKPGGMDQTGGRKYPLLLTQYSGPGSQEVRDRWTIDWEDALVQQGYIVACVDPRGTGGKGEQFKKLTYGRMGELETEDQIAFARHLASLPYVDGDRIGIYGWSYGGFMSLNCILKGADVFRMAISVAPVTSWRLYDSVYTERVNGLPQNNASGYDDPSPINHAGLLEGKLLLMHGSADDNVHVQNTYKMAYELVKHGKQFDMMIYPDDNHSMMPSGRFNVRQKMVSYCIDNL